MLSMPQISSLSPVQKTTLALLQQSVDLPGLHRFARLLYGPLFGRRRYYSSYLNRFRFVFDTRTWVGFLTGLGLAHRDIDKVLGVLFPLIPNKEIVFLDVGANEGFVTLLAYSRARQLGRVLGAYCFDPNPDAFAYLLENTRLNSFSLNAYQVAIGASVEEREMLVAEVSRHSTLLSQSGQRTIERSTVPVTTIDCFCEEHHVAPDIIKVDVEGYELSVLSGAAMTLSKHKPFLVMEVNPRLLAMGGHSADALVTKLRQLGYGIYYVDSAIAKAVKSPRNLAKGPQWHGHFAVEDGDQIDKYLWDVLAVPHQPDR